MSNAVLNIDIEHKNSLEAKYLQHYVVWTNIVLLLDPSIIYFEI